MDYPRINEKKKKMFCGSSQDVILLKGSKHKEGLTEEKKIRVV